MGDEDKAIKPFIDKNARRVTENAEGGLVAKAALAANDPGFIQGHGAVFNNVDFQNEIIRPGTFTKTIKERVPTGKVKLMTRHFAHGGDVPELIGTITSAKEDDKGLFFHADLAKTQLAQEVRQMVIDGHVDGASVGFMPIEWGFIKIKNQEVVEHKEGKLFEITVTARPANDLARLTGAKSLEGALQHIGLLTKEYDERNDSSPLTSDEVDRLLEEHLGGREHAQLVGKALSDMLVRMKAVTKPDPSAPPPVVEVGTDRIREMQLRIQQSKTDLLRLSSKLN